MYLIACGRTSGWVMRFVGEFIWLAIGIAMDMSSMYLWGAAFMAIDAMGFVKSQRETKRRMAADESPKV